MHPHQLPSLPGLFSPCTDLYVSLFFWLASCSVQYRFSQLTDLTTQKTKKTKTPQALRKNIPFHFLPTPSPIGGQSVTAATVAVHVLCRATDAYNNSTLAHVSSQWWVAATIATHTYHGIPMDRYTTSEYFLCLGVIKTKVLFNSGMVPVCT